MPATGELGAVMTGSVSGRGDDRHGHRAVEIGNVARKPRRDGRWRRVQQLGHRGRRVRLARFEQPSRLFEQRSRREREHPHLARRRQTICREGLQLAERVEALEWKEPFEKRVGGLQALRGRERVWAGQKGLSGLI